MYYKMKHQSLGTLPPELGSIILTVIRQLVIVRRRSFVYTTITKSDEKNFIHFESVLWLAVLNK